MMTSTTPNGFNMNTISIPEFVKCMQKQHGLTQADASKKAGVGLRFVRELEQGKKTENGQRSKIQRYCQM